jgi:demethylmenaquinone methyltransferase/2-methoxy-6-polyprenyl-1,4-benzoquinol methylase
MQDTELKQEYVDHVFHQVATRYDVMNDAMSFGLHRLWKRHAIALLKLRPGMSVLDLAGGTGDLATLIHPLIQPTGPLVLGDINASMLKVGRDRLLDRGILNNTFVIQLNAESLPFTHTFDCITIAFGLRNVPRKEVALKSMHQALKPGGKLLILEFSHPTLPLFKQGYDFYSFNIIPKLGKWIAQDEASYQYLVESIRKHPTQPQLCQLMSEAGFSDCRYENLMGGIVAIHQGLA